MKKHTFISKTMHKEVQKTSTSKSYKPLIATSLALALGASVAVADPTITGGNIDGMTWTSTGDYYQPSSNSITATTGTITTLTSDKGLQIGGSGTDTLTINLGGKVTNGTDFILNLSNVGLSPYAFVGNLTVSGSGYDSNRQFQAIFGKNFKGNITLNSGGDTRNAPALTFNNGAKLEGNLTAGFEDTKIVFNENGGAITGSVTKNNSGNLIIDFDPTYGGSIGGFNASSNKGTTTINNLTSIDGAITISNGTNTLAFKNETNDKTYSGNASISGGTTTFLGLTSFTTTASNNNLININSSPTIVVNFGDETHKVDNFTGTFNINLSDGGSNIAINLNNTNNTLVGNVYSTEGAASGGAQVNIYFNGNGENKYQGNLTAKGGNYTNNPRNTNTVTFTSGTKNIFIGDLLGTMSAYTHDGTNNVIFQSGESLFQGNINAGNNSPVGRGNNNVTFNTSGKSQIIGNIIANAGTNRISFTGDGVQIINGNISTVTNAVPNSRVNEISFDGEAKITGKTEDGSISSPRKQILLTEGSNTITATKNLTLEYVDIVGQGKWSGGSNTFIVGGNLVFGENKANSTDVQKIETSASDRSGTKNLFDIQGTTTLNNDISIVAYQRVSYGVVAQQNIFKFGDKVNFNNYQITELSTSLSLTAASNASGKAGMYNILSFDGTEETQVKIGDINNHETVSSNNTGNYTGYNYIGKNLTSGAGKTLTLNSSIFSNETWADSSHQANAILTVTGDIYITSNGSANYVNVKELIANTITASGGVNYLVAGQGSITGNITSSGGTNNIVFSGDSSSNSITSDISSSGGRNNITLSGTTNNVTGKISATGSGVNNITANDGNFTISGISTKDYNGNGGNILNLGNATLTINARSGDTTQSINGKAIYAQNGNNTNTITSQIIYVNGAMMATGGVSGSRSSNSLSGTTINVTGSITGNADNTNNFTLLGNNSTLTLQGQTNQITTLTAYTPSSARETGVSTLILDGSTQDNTTTINSINNGENLIVKFNGAGSDHKAELNLAQNSLTLKSLILGNASTNNIFNLTNNQAISFASQVLIDSGSIDFNFNSSSLDFISTLNNAGTINFNLSGNNTISGDLSNTLEMALNFNSSSSSLTLGDTLSNSGTLDVNFNASSSVFSGNITNNNLLNFNLNTLSATLNANLNNQGTTNFNLIGSTSTPSSQTDIVLISDTLSLSSGTYNFNFSNASGSSLTLKDTTNSLTPLILNGGVTNFNFTENGAFNSAISANSGSLNILISDGKEATFSENIEGNANTIITFASDDSTNANSVLNLNASSYSFGSIALTNASTKNIINIGSSQSSNVSFLKTLSISSIQELSFNLSNSSTLTLSKGLSNSGTLNLIFSSGDSVFDGRLSNNSGATTNITVGQSLLDENNQVISQTQSVSANFTQGISGNGALSLTFLGNYSSIKNNSSLILEGGATYSINSITSNSNNALLVLDGKTSANVANAIDIAANSALTFGFSGDGNSTITANAGISVASGGTLGVSIGGNGNKEIISANNQAITLGTGTTLLVEFLENSNASVTLGDGSAIVIGNDQKSIINFYGNSTANLNGGITLRGGSNTINFLGNATLGKITLESGNNTINVYEGITGLISDVRDVGNVANTLNLYANSTLDLSGNSLEAGMSSDGSTPLSNTLNFLGDNSRLLGGFGTQNNSSGSNATINIGDSNSSSINSYISGNVSNATLSFKSANSSLTLGGSNNTLSIDTSSNVAGKIILDASSQGANNDVNTTISTAISDANAITLAYGSGSENKTFTLTEANNNISNIELDTNSKNNTLAFIKGANTISQAPALSQGQGLTLALGNSTTDSSPASSSQISLTLSNGFNAGEGSATLRIEGNNNADALISGGDVSVTNLDMIANTSASLTLSNTNTNTNTLTANQESTIKLDASNNNVALTVDNAINGDKLSFILSGSDSSHSATLTLNNQSPTLFRARNAESTTLKAITLDSSSSSVNDNVLNLAGGVINITDGINVATSQGLSINLLGESTTLNSAIATNGANANTAISIGDNSIPTFATITKDITTANNGTTSISLSPDSTLTLQGANNTLSTISGNGVLVLDGLLNDKGTSGDVSVSVSGDVSGASIEFASGSESKTLSLNSNNTLNSLTLISQSTNNTLSLTGTGSSNTTTIARAINISDAQSLNISLNNAILHTQEINTYLGGALSFTLVGTNTLSSTLNNQGDVSFNVAANANATLNSDNLTFNSGNNSFNLSNNLSLKDLQGGDTHKLSTLGGTTSINFDAGTPTLNAAEIYTGSRALTQINVKDNIHGGIESSITIERDDLGKYLGVVDVNLGANSTLALRGNDNTLSRVSGNGTLSLGGAVSTILNEVNGVAIQFVSTQAEGAKLNLVGLNNSLSSLSFDANATKGALSLSSGNTSIANAVSIGSSQTLTLDMADSATLTLNSGISNSGTLNLTFSSGNSTFDGALTNNGTTTIQIGSNAIAQTQSVTSNFTQGISGSGTLSLSFEGEFDSNHNASFTLGNGSSTLASSYTFKSITSNSNNALLALNGAVNANISEAMSIESGKSLSLGFVGDGTSVINAQKGISVASGGILGISIGGSGNKSITFNGSNIDSILAQGTTLKVDFLENSNAVVTLGSNTSDPITIGKGVKSIINFYGATSATLSGGGIKLAGGSNEVNFYGDATLSNLILESGENTIRVYDDVNATLGASSFSESTASNTLILKNNSILTLEGANNQAGILKNASVNVEGVNASIDGILTNASITLQDSSSLTLNNVGNTINSINGGAHSILALGNNSDVAFNTSITGSNVGLKFGEGDGAKTFKFNSNNNSVVGVEFADNSTNNTLLFVTGNNTLGAISLSDNNSLTLSLGEKGSTEAISLSLSSLSGGEVNAKINSTLSTLRGGNIALNTLSLNQDSSLNLQASSILVNALNSTGSAALILGDTLSHQATQAQIKNTDKAENITLEFVDGSESKTLVLGDSNTQSKQAIASIALRGNSTHNTLSLENTLTTIADAINIASTQALNIALNNSTLDVGNTISNEGSLSISLAGSNTLNATLSNSGELNFNVLAQNTSLTASKFDYANASINFNKANATLQLLSRSSSSNPIALANGTSINFNATNTQLNNAINAQGDLFVNVGLNTKNFIAAGIEGNLSGGNIEFSLDKNSSLTLKGASNTINTLNGQGLLILDASSKAVSANINTINNQASITLKGGSKTKAELSIGGSSTLNTLNVLTNATLSASDASSSLSRASSVQHSLNTLNLGEEGAQSNFNLNNITLSLSTLNSLGEGNTLALNNSNLQVQQNLRGENLTVSLSADKGKYSTLSLNATSNTLSTLSLGESTEYGVLLLNNKSASTITSITPLSSSQTLLLDFKEGAQLTLGESINGSGKVNLDFSPLGGNILYLEGESNSLNDISGNGHISLSNTLNVTKASANANRMTYRTLNINGAIDGNLDFTLYTDVNSSFSDKVVIASSQNKEQTHNIHLIFSPTTTLDEINRVVNEGENIAIATYNASNNNITMNVGNTTLGFDQVLVETSKETTDINAQTNASGNYETLFIKGAKSNGVIEAQEQAVASALTLNYDLYLANFNSLNKRMGELRENNHSQGVWARVFNGSQNNDLGLGSKSNYTTIQAGYDYAFGGEGFNNYLGVALSYALSSVSSNNPAIDTNGNQRSIQDISSSAFEVGVYNSFVSDSGWYNDTILKFSYLLSDFSLSDSQDSSSSESTKNFGLTLSDEVGYLFRAGKESEWMITPQVELSMGYINQGDLKQTLGSIYYLNAIAESVMLLRGRAGVSLGYDFKAFTQNKGVNASVYVGAFYEYDYMKGGNVSLNTNASESNYGSVLENDDRVVLNVGTNVSIKDNTRLYFDFEKSFDGKITTEYQVNLGVRYSFGENTAYVNTLKQDKAPLKLEQTQEETKEDTTTKENKEQEGESKK